MWQHLLVLTPVGQSVSKPSSSIQIFLQTIVTCNFKEMAPVENCKFFIGSCGDLDGDDDW